ncbi:DUF6529 family protein [Streptomyces humidus]|uniref:DUF6529 family protein n=1 Tax=Streptomyces humidus TaxID=52259 RepID=UPI0035714ADB
MRYGKLPAPAWSAAPHRRPGRAAFPMAAPVAVHRPHALGWQTYGTRVMGHPRPCLLLPGLASSGARSRGLLLLGCVQCQDAAARPGATPGTAAASRRRTLFAVLTVVRLA